MATSRRKNITGKRFGRLLVISFVEMRGRSVRWLCRCDCGTERTFDGGSLRLGRAASCGCSHKGQMNAKTHGHTINDAASPTYRSWYAMIKRCENPKAINFSNYGGRGIKVCEGWRESFAAFLADMGPRPDGCTLDRINNDGNYELTNCRWATRSQQLINQRPRDYAEINRKGWQTRRSKGV